MEAIPHFTRINTIELKQRIFERIGHERAETYFSLLQRYFSSKLDKVNFDKSCIQTLGNENVSLHNHLIRSIVQNARHAKTPPINTRKIEELGVRNHLHPLEFPHSLRKCRTRIKFRDRPSPLGPLEKSLSRIQEQSAAELATLSGKPRTSPVEDGEEVEQFAVNHSSRRWSSITAPYGVSVNLDGARKAPRSDIADSCQSNGELPDTRSLGRRLQKKLASEGVVISLDGANLMNKGVDVQLKKLILQCMKMGSRTSFHDFRVAMELNPSILGEDWPTQLEKIGHYTHDDSNF